MAISGSDNAIIARRVQVSRLFTTTGKVFSNKFEVTLMKSTVNCAIINSSLEKHPRYKNLIKLELNNEKR